MRTHSGKKVPVAYSEQTKHDRIFDRAKHTRHSCKKGTNMKPIIADKLMLAIDNLGRRDDHQSTRIGASSLGKKCSRELWYGFRWAARPKFPPNVLRLFDRGDREEAIFEKLFFDAGIQYWPHDPATGEQYLVPFKNKHLGGRTDGQGKGLPDLPPKMLFLGEFKTHNDKSFQYLIKHGVQKAKPVHYTQAQLYANELNIPWALYGAVNKNDDHLYFELLECDPNHAKHHLQRADMIIAAYTPPERFSRNVDCFDCKYCDFNKICHAGATIDATCRMCVHSHPLIDGDWWCGQHDIRLSISEQQAGCQDHVQIDCT